MAEFNSPMYGGIQSQTEESPWMDYGYRFVNTILAGSAAVLVNIIVGRTLSTIKTKIRRFLAVGEMNFVVDVLFGTITLTLTAAAGLYVDRRLKWRRMLAKYGGHGDPPWEYYFQLRSEL